MASTITASVVTGGSNSHATTAAEVNALGTDFLTAGCVGTLTNTNGVAPNTGSFAVNAQGSPAMFVDVTAGTAWITATPSGQSSQKIRANMTANYTSYAISANATGSTKYDWIYLQVDATKANNPASDASDVISLVTSRSSSNSTDNGTPPTYGTLLAVVTVANGASSITNANITDSRTQATITAAASSNGWTTGLATPNTVTANGNRSYSLVFNGTDLTGTLSPGMRVRTSRLVSAPTQCTSLNGTTQYYSKTSPAGMTFTNNFVVSAWVKLSSYPGTAANIASRFNGTSGWQMYIDSSGRLLLVGYNGGSGNNSYLQSYQSIPLNKWVHVAAQLDMATFTATPTTSYGMIDGVDVPVSVARGGTNPTALVQAGNLEIGGANGGGNPFPGKIAQVAIYSAKVTEATILASMHQTLVGTETSLISAYSFNNSISDLNANANNLTANGSAVATNADSPFSVNSFGTATGTTDYGIITKATFSTNTTLVVQVPEANTIPTSGGVSAVAYSLQKAPYGFPAQQGKWVVATYYKSQQSTAGIATSAWSNIGSAQLSVPTGSWRLGYQVTTEMIPSSGTTNDFLVGLGTTSAAATDAELTVEINGTGSAITTGVTRYKYIDTTNATSYYYNASNNAAAITATIYLRGDSGVCSIFAECAYL